MFKILWIELAKGNSENTTVIGTENVGKSKMLSFHRNGKVNTERNLRASKG